VYADRRYWTVDPFGGVIADGYLYGRGAIDMKSTGILHLAALLALKRARVPLKRDLVFLATADEEAGSEFGAQFIADRRPDWLAGAEYAISEIGLIQMRSGLTAPLAAIVISEKTGLPITLTARGEPGHGSMPWPDTAPTGSSARSTGCSRRSGRRACSRKCRSSSPAWPPVLPVEHAVGYDDLAGSLEIRPSASVSTQTGSTRRWSGRPLR